MSYGAADKDLVSKQTDEVEEGEQDERRAGLGRWRHRNLAADVAAGLKELRRSGTSFPSLSGSFIPCFQLLPPSYPNQPPRPRPPEILIDDLQIIPVSNDAYFVVLIMLLVPKKKRKEKRNEAD